MIVVHTKHGQRIKIPNGAAVAATQLPALPGNTPAAALSVVTSAGQTLAVFRVSEVAGYTVNPSA